MIQLPGGVLCCGNAVEDVLVRPVDEVIYDRTTWVESIGFSLGGNGANTAYALAVLGTPVRLISTVGRDETGDRVLKTLGDAGVDTSAVRTVEGLPTAATVVVVHSSGARAFLHNPGVNREAFADGIAWSADLVQGFSHFHLGNPFSTMGIRSRTAQILRTVQEHGLTTSVDAGWDTCGEWLDIIGPGLPHTDVLFVNEQESRLLSGCSNVADGARFFLDRGVGSVVTKIGAAGCWFFEDATALHVPGFCVDAIDSTGAGDCFAGAFLAGIRHGMSSWEAARFANAAGALSVCKLGAVGGLLSFDETLAWIQRAASDQATS